MALASSCKQRVSADNRDVGDDGLILLHSAPMTIPVQPVRAMDLAGIDPDLLVQIHRLGHALGFPRIALVGGAVRDLLIQQQRGEDLRTVQDFDFVVEGDALRLAEALQKSCGMNRVPILRSHGAFKTVAMNVDGLSLDLPLLPGNYPSPAENPSVEMSSLELDLSRRDFTINAMALVLREKADQLSLLDPFSGALHLAKGQIVFLHANSVKDDPTRVVRAARYASRLGFVLRADAHEQIMKTVHDWPWTWQYCDQPDAAPPALATRLRMELDLLFEKEPWPQALQNLEEWGAFPLLDVGLDDDPHRLRRLRWAQRLGLPLLPALLLGANDPLALAERLQLPRLQQRWLGQCAEILAWLESSSPELLQLSWSPADWSMALESKGWTVESVAFAVATAHQFWRPMLRWCGRWRHLRAHESAQDLMDQGWKPGPGLGAELRRRRMERLDIAR